MLFLGTASALLRRLTLTLRLGNMDYQKTRNEETMARLSSNLGILRKKKEKYQQRTQLALGLPSKLILPMTWNCCPLCKGCSFANSQQLPCPPKYEAYPGLKWIIAGGCPCQDLAFAGTHKGLFGLAGPCSRLFFVFLCVIFTVQQLCGPQAVRFLAENAASMLEMHYRAFCKLLNIDPMPPHKYLWNPSKFGYQVTRRRNFFRNFDDVENILSPTLVFGDQYGPLLRPNGDTIPLAPLLRTRDTLPNGIIRASWTLYQPHALVWVLTGMERVFLPQKWLLEPITFPDANGNPSFPFLSWSSGRLFLSY